MYPSIGRIVHYTLPTGYVRPALVVNVYGPSTVELRVFTAEIDEHTNILSRNPVSQAQTLSPERGKWHWPDTNDEGRSQITFVQEPPTGQTEPSTLEPKAPGQPAEVKEPVTEEPEAPKEPVTTEPAAAGDKSAPSPEDEELGSAPKEPEPETATSKPLQTEADAKAAVKVQHGSGGTAAKRK